MIHSRENTSRLRPIFATVTHEIHMHIHTNLPVQRVPVQRHDGTLMRPLHQRLYRMYKSGVVFWLSVAFLLICNCDISGLFVASVCPHSIPSLP